MTASNCLPRTPRRFAWLVWLALLLPLAQWAAAVHVQSHWGKEGSTSLDHQATAADICAQCVAAASIAGGGAVTHEVSAAILPAPAQLIQWASTAFLSVVIFSGYRSRAPPGASH